MSNAVKILRWGCIVAAVPALAVLAGQATDVASEPGPDEIDEGGHLYTMYCAACHGEKARGNGPTAAMLKKRPTDLTRLALKGGKLFPVDEVREAIDGRGIEHGTREMPLWGLAFQNWSSDANQEQEVSSRIDALVAWIESIQR